MLEIQMIKKNISYERKLNYTWIGLSEHILKFENELPMHWLYIHLMHSKVQTQDPLIRNTYLINSYFTKKGYL